ncbi:FAD-dependent monooxygenase [Sphingobium sp. SCG-1]|uniref:FAD-dependent monooxygenase n=1 Tax=Sphingobium sp. SCG-1 TaxID=2072936 RepID=UPI00166FE83C|nr:FAD-dependent monooxygenase [Sphingobium sp. SCG-1]
MENASNDCDVLVVGAGPTGLMAANLLKRAGVNVRLVEQRGEATRESRAFAVQARTLELMDSIGLARNFLAQGVRADSVNIHVKGRFRGGLDFARANAGDTPYPFILMIPQSRLEAILSDDCSALGVSIERQTTVTAVEQDGQGVTTHADGADGPFRIRSAYVIGADGSRSIVRQATGLGWDGDMLPQRFLLADCKVHWPLDHESFRVFLNGSRIGLFLPLDGAKVSRVMATDVSGSFGDEDGSKPAPLDLAEMEEGLSKAIALPVRLSDPVWVTRYRAHHRFTDCYRANRAFIAGDAAHIHSPAGGQGMNTGLQDAANLAWKLAAVLRAGAKDGLLDSYDQERRPVGENVIKSTGRLFAAAAGQTGAKAAVRDQIISTVLPLLTRVSPFQKRAFFNTSQRAIAYPLGAYVSGTASKLAPPGARAPDAPVHAVGSVFALLRGYRFTILVFSREKLNEADTASITAAQTRLMARGLAIGIIAGAQPDEDVVFQRYGVGQNPGQAVVLVRPDGYIAWRGESLSLDLCESHAAMIMPRRGISDAS